MTQETERKIQYVKPVIEYDPVHFEVSFIGGLKAADTKYGVAMLIPADEETAKARYNCSISDLLRIAVNTLATRVSYNTAFTFELDNDKKKVRVLDVDHAKLQALADEYKVGNRATGVATQTKADAATYNELKTLGGGLTAEEIKEAVRRMAASKIAKAQKA